MFKRTAKVIGREEILSAPKSPGQNPCCKRVIGALRREGTADVIASGELHLARILREFADSRNTSRCHFSLDGNAPESRRIEGGDGEVVAAAVIGGIHPADRRAP